jgi:hypothetical protein
LSRKKIIPLPGRDTIEESGGEVNYWGTRKPVATRPCEARYNCPVSLGRNAASIPDSGSRCLGKLYDNEWMKDNRYFEPSIALTVAETVGVCHRAAGGTAATIRGHSSALLSSTHAASLESVAMSREFPALSEPTVGVLTMPGKLYLDKVVFSEQRVDKTIFPGHSQTIAIFCTF